MRVLGIDCGTEYTGYGVVDLLSDDRLVCIICGAIKVSPRDPMPARLSRISAGLDVAEYSPLSIKSAVVGYGRAEKQQVQQMVTRLLQLEHIPEPADAADALAIAICDLHTSATRERQRPLASTTISR